jgi:hypothetical protein
MALKSVEEMIRAARERGEFDNLKGRGRPLDHSEYFAQPEELRVAHHLLRNSGFVPPEVELMRDLGEARSALAACQDPARRKELAARVEKLSIKLDLLKVQGRRR